MDKRVMLLLLCLMLLAACGGPGRPAQQDDRSETTIGKGGQATPPPYTGPTAEPGATAQPGDGVEPTPAEEVTNLPVDQGVVIYTQPGIGSVEGISLPDGQPLVLADPNPDHPSSLPWSLSPDGKTIAVVTGIHMDGSLKNGRLSAAALWLVGVDASNPRKLLELVGESMGQNSMELMGVMSALVRSDYQLLPWTMDGAALVVASAHEGQVDLYLVPVDGSAPRRLTETPDLEIQPLLSPLSDRVAYASATNFGTGAGWGGVKAEVLPLAGDEPRSLIGDVPPELQPSTAQMLGWLKDTVVVQTSELGSSNTTLWASAEGEPRMIFRSPAHIMAAASSGTLTFATNTYFGEPQNGPDGLFEWVVGDEAPRKLVDLGGINSVHTPSAQMGSAALLCLGDDGRSHEAAYWNGSELVELGEGTCGESVAWGDSDTVAYGSGFVDEAGVQALPRYALPAGWSKAGVYYFAPTDDTQTQWQLYLQQGGARQAIGQPIAQKPERPRLIRS